MEQVRQGFVKRLVAAIIDGVILMIVIAVITMVLGRTSKIAMILPSVIVLAYMSLEVVKAQTLGKMLMKIKITNPDGTPAAPDALLKRFAIKNAASVLGLVGAIVGLSIITLLGSVAGLVVFVGCFLVFREDKLALHDILAKTAVFGPNVDALSAVTAAVPVTPSQPVQ